MNSVCKIKRLLIKLISTIHKKYSNLSSDFRITRYHDRLESMKILTIFNINILYTIIVNFNFVL